MQTGKTMIGKDDSKESKESDYEDKDQLEEEQEEEMGELKEDTKLILLNIKLAPN
jgi:hypothetical protein